MRFGNTDVFELFDCIITNSLNVMNDTEISNLHVFSDVFSLRHAEQRELVVVKLDQFCRAISCKMGVLFPGHTLELLDIFAVIRILITISIYLHYTDHLK
jgi:hypothetical protein